MTKSQIRKIKSITNGIGGGIHCENGTFTVMNNFGYYAVKIYDSDINACEFDEIIYGFNKHDYYISTNRYFDIESEALNGKSVSISMKELKEYIKVEKQKYKDAGKEHLFSSKRFIIRKEFDTFYNAEYMLDLFVCMGMTSLDVATLHFNKNKSKAIYVTCNDAIGIIMPINSKYYERFVQST